MVMIMIYQPGIKKLNQNQRAMVSHRRPGLPRRLAAILYDSVLIFALLLFASAIITLPVAFLVGEVAAEQLATNPLFRLWLSLIPLFFYLWFWTHGGETLGMRAWRLRIIRENGSALRLKDALIRLLVASFSTLLLGSGFLWMLIDRDSLTWHDRISKTQLILITKGSRF